MSKIASFTATIALMSWSCRDYEEVRSENTNDTIESRSSVIERNVSNSGRTSNQRIEAEINLDRISPVSGLVRKKNRSVDETQELGDFFLELADTEPQLVLDLIKDNKESFIESHRYYDKLLKTLIEKLPEEEILRFIDGISNRARIGGDQMHLLGSLARIAGTLNVREGIQSQIVDLLRKDEHEISRFEYLQALTRQSPDHALIALKDLGLDSQSEKRALAGIAREIGRENPEAALTMLQEVGMISGDSAILASSWLERDLSSALSWMSELTAKDLGSLLNSDYHSSSIFSLLSHEDTLSLLQRVPSSSSNFTALLLGAKSQETAEQGILLIDSLPSSPLKDKLFQSYFSQLSIRDESHLVDLFNEVQSREKTTATLGLLFNSGLQFPERTMELALAQSEPSEFVSETIRGITGRDASVAAAFLIEDRVKSAMSTDQYVAMAAQTAAVYARTDLDGALSWFENLEGKSKSAATKSIATVWIANDPINASKWISDLPNGEPRHAAIRVLVEELRNSDPEAATEWDATLGD